MIDINIYINKPSQNSSEDFSPLCQPIFLFQLEVLRSGGAFQIKKKCFFFPRRTIILNNACSQHLRTG